MKSENDDAYKIFNKFEEVVSEVNMIFSKAPSKENGEDDKKCHRFIISIMRLVVQKNI